MMLIKRAMSYFLLIGVISINVCAEEKEHNLTTNHYLAQVPQQMDDVTYEDSDDTAWEDPIIRNLDISANFFHTKGGNNGHLRSVLPLFFDDEMENSFFLAPGVTYYQQRINLNAGLGYRHLNESASFMWGLNTFYDYDHKGKNRRSSQGLEIYFPYVGLTGNIYQSLGKWHASRVNANTNEKTAKGGDLKLSVAMPFYPKVSLSALYFSWKGEGIDLYRNGRYTNNLKGMDYSIGYRPISLVGINVVRTVNRHKSNVDKQNNTALWVNIFYDFSESITSQTSYEWTPDSLNLKNSLFKQPERQFGILANTNFSKIPTTSSLLTGGHQGGGYVISGKTRGSRFYRSDSPPNE